MKKKERNMARGGRHPMKPRHRKIFFRKTLKNSNGKDEKGNIINGIFLTWDEKEHEEECLFFSRAHLGDYYFVLFRVLILRLVLFTTTTTMRREGWRAGARGWIPVLSFMIFVFRPSSRIPPFTKLTNTHTNVYVAILAYKVKKIERVGLFFS